jgi:alginate O-acetyltransferase complex protein AlgI
MNDPVFDHPARFDGLTLLTATLGYSAQIYCDFSGYSDMAIGSAKMIGYDLPENFALPYLSASLTEFWRRWHITLSTWLRDYLYIPLGGNRRGALRTYVHLMLTMLLGGLWHGASWNFVIWGGLHGAALALHRWLRQRRPGRSWPRFVAIPATFAFVSLAWIPFRLQTFAQSLAFMNGLFSWQHGVRWVAVDSAWLLGLVLSGHVLGPLLFSSRLPAWLAKPFDLEVRHGELSGPYLRLGLRTVAGAWLVCCWLLLAFLLAPTRVSPFIYFQF